jgi:hypothetical protein
MSKETIADLPEWTEEERLLLASADLDQPPAESLRRTLQAAGAATAVATGVAATHATASTLAGKATSGFVVAKWLAVATCVGGAAAGVHVWRQQRAANEAALASAASATNALPARGPAAPVAPPVAAVAEPVASSEPAPNTDDVGPSAASPAPRSASARPAASVTTQPDLTRDIAVVDEARQALRAGHASEALAALDRYDAEFGKTGALRVEASVLRIEATARAGNRARAQQLARAFLAHNGKSPYAARVKAILEP